MRALALLLLAALLAGCAGPPPAMPPGTTPPTTGTPRPNCTDLISAANGSNANHTKVEVQTNRGTLKVELFDDAAPRTAANFKTYVQAGFYDHVVFHRILEGFMMQGGKFDNTTQQAKEPTQGPVTNEAASSGCLNKAYTLSMARTQDPNSARTEFFVNFVDNQFLDPSGGSAGYAVFGIVYEGREVAQTIANAPVHVYNPATDPMCQPEQGNRPNCPDQPVEMVRVRVV